MANLALSAHASMMTRKCLGEHPLAEASRFVCFQIRFFQTMSLMRLDLPEALNPSSIEPERPRPCHRRNSEVTASPASPKESPFSALRGPKAWCPVPVPNPFFFLFPGLSLSPSWRWRIRGRRVNFVEPSWVRGRSCSLKPPKASNDAKKLLPTCAPLLQGNHNRTFVRDPA